MSKYIAIVSVALSCSQMPSGVLGLNPTTSPAGSATAQSSSSINVEWTKVSGATSYGIFRSASSGGSYVQVGSAGDTSFLDTGLTANIEYYYKIMANDSVHKIESQFSAEVSAITMTVQPPALISPANGTTGQPLIRNLSWSAVSGATSYHVQVSRDSTFTTIFAEDSTRISDSLTLTGLANSTSYYWRVRSKDPGGVSIWTSSWSFTTIIAAPSMPVLVSPLDSAANQPVSLLLSWNKAARASTYYFQVATDTGFVNVANADSTLTDTSKAISGLANNTAYYWRVKAKNDGGTSAWSGVRSFFTIVAAPQMATLTSPIDGASDLPVTPTLAWSTVIGAITYHVQVSTSNTFATVLIDDSTLTLAAKSLSGLANGTQYYWRVQAKNAGGVSAWTSPWSFATIIAAPQTPALTSPVDGATGQPLTPTLAWSSVTGAATYHLQVSTVNTFASIFSEDSGLTSPSKALLGLANSTQYFWRVQAKNAGGVSAWTSPWTFTAIMATPQTPTLTSPADGTTGLSLTPTLTWSTVTGAATYHVQMSTVNTFSTVLIEDSTLTSSSRALSGLANGTQYYWRVQAKNVGGVSAWTSPWGFTTIIAAPTTPTLTAPTDGTTGLSLAPTLTWSMVNGAETYHVQMSTVNTFATILIEDSTLTLPSKALSGLANGMQYYWRVQAKNGVGVSAWTSPWGFTTIIAAPQAPVLTSPVDAAIGQPLAPTLTWSMVASAATYSVQVSTVNTFATILVEDSALTSTSKALSGLSNSTVYYWRVQAKNLAGTSNWTSDWSFITVQPAPLTPTLTSPVNGSTGVSLAPTLFWSTVTSAATYHVQVSASNTFATILIEDSTLTSASKPLSGLANSTQYYWRVQAKNAGGVSAWTNPWGFTTIMAAPQTPTLTSPADGATGQLTMPTLTWSTVIEAATYRVQVSTNNTFGTNLIDDSTLSTTSKAISGLSYNAVYYWRVQAKNAGGASSWTSPWSMTILPMPAPTNVIATSTSVTAVTVTWNISDNSVNQFKIYRSMNDTLYTFIGIAGTTSFSDMGLSSATLYYYKVRSVKGTDSSAFSAMDTAETPSYILTSPGIGSGWTMRSLVGSTPQLSGTYGNGQYILVGMRGSILASPNTSTWTTKTSGVIRDLHSIAYNSLDSLFVAVGDSGTLITSRDGSAWTIQNSGTNSSLFSVTCGYVIAANYYGFVAVGASGTILTSINGTTWTSQNSSTTNDLYSVTYAYIYADDKFVAVGSSGTILTSYTGTTWAIQNSGTTNTLYSVIYGNNRLMAVGSSGTILFSYVGAEWYVEPSGITSTLYSVALGNDLFLAVGSNGTIMYSDPNGDNWQLDDEKKDFRFIFYASQFLVF
jgi:hypothetical protein